MRIHLSLLRDEEVTSLIEELHQLQYGNAYLNHRPTTVQTTCLLH